MNLGQMLMVLLGIVLFSTIIIVFYNNMANQVDMTERTIYLQQGIRIADKYLQEFEAELVGGMIGNFNDVNAVMFNGLQRPDIIVGEATYTPRVFSRLCDQRGISLPIGATIPNPDYIRLFVTVEITTAKRGTANPYRVGYDLTASQTENEAFSKIFHNINF